MGNVHLGSGWLQQQGTKNYAVDQINSRPKTRERQEKENVKVQCTVGQTDRERITDG
jgi:hypothetical protein